jgi:cell division protein FtsB
VHSRTLATESTRGITKGDYTIQSVSRNTLLTFFLVLAVFVVMIGPLRSFMIESQHVAKLNEELKAKELEKEFMGGERERLKDDRFVIAYAREHFNLILPGETAIHIADPESAGSAKDIQSFSNNEKSGFDKSTKKTVDKYKKPWYERIYDAIDSAGAGGDVQQAQGAGASDGTQNVPEGGTEGATS